MERLPLPCIRLSILTGWARGQRAVIILSYADTERLHRIEEIILRRNCEALDGKQTGVRAARRPALAAMC